MKDFKYQMTLNVFLSKEKGNGGKEFTTVHFNSTAKKLIDFKYGLSKSFQQVLY